MKWRSPEFSGRFSSEDTCVWKVTPERLMNPPNNSVKRVFLKKIHGIIELQEMLHDMGMFSVNPLMRNRKNVANV